MFDEFMRKLRRTGLRTIVDYIYITIGLILYAVAWAFFFLPYKMVTGGVTGIASLIFYAVGIPVSYTYFVINIILLAIALKVLGFKFLAKTTYAIIALTVFLDVFQNFVTNADGTMYQLLGPGEQFMAVILGAALTGTALAVVFLRNGSTGGTDIIAAIVNKYRDISLGRVILMADLCIIFCSYPIFEDWRKIVFGMVLMAIETFTLDYIMNARRESVQFLVFSRKYDDIARLIATKMGRGVTLLDAHGWYTNEETKVLCVLAKKREQVSILRIIKRVDPHAFISVGAVSGVYGEGFDAIKVKVEEEKSE